MKLLPIAFALCLLHVSASANNVAKPRKDLAGFHPRPLHKPETQTNPVIVPVPVYQPVQQYPVPVQQYPIIQQYPVQYPVQQYPHRPQYHHYHHQPQYYPQQYPQYNQFVPC